MLSYDAPVPANKGHKDAPSALAVSTAASTASSTATTSNASTANTSPTTAHKHHHIWLVTGPAGCGKTTVASHLASNLDMPYIEGDTFHPAANIEKMSSGIPLTDADRWDWLTALRDESVRRISAGSEGVVLTCSALKRKYRDVIRVAAYFDHNVLVHFIFLDATEELLLDRVSRRQGHYMGANMVASQFEILERPTKDETDVITVDVSQTMEQVKADALSQVMDKMHDDNE